MATPMRISPINRHTRSVAWVVVLLVSLCSSRSTSQYVPKSPYLNDPTLAIAYVDSCASFWAQVYDSVNGGFYTNVGRQGNVKTPYDKSIISQTRDAYGFVRAFMLNGDERYLTLARRALDFMYQHYWDTTYGGWINTVDRSGNQTSAGWNKTAFDQHYALLGPSAYYEATRDTLDWSWLMKGYSNNETNLWDPSPATQGYYDNVSFDWSSRNGKTFNATVDAVTTHVLALYLMTLDPAYKERLLQLADQMLQRLVGSMGQQVIGFVENYQTDWSWNNNTANYNTRTIMGHVLKTAWCLGRIHQLFPDSSYVAAAESLVGDVWTKGYDHDFGGPYKDYDRVTGSMFMYGQDTAKAWWQMEQAVTAGLILYDITRNDQYLQMADETVDFFMKYFVDHVYGDVYADRFKNGAPIVAWGNDKGNSSKAGYHSIELGYYLYLYGGLFVKQEPVTLHYRFQAADVDRSIWMNPLAYDSVKYRIKEVVRDGNVYQDYDASARSLQLPAGTGGLFTVTYEPVQVDAVMASRSLPAGFELCQNYPNPFNPSTTIRYGFPGSSHVTLTVFNTLGQRVAVLQEGEKEAGYHEVVFDASGLASGVYLYRLQVRPLDAAIGRDSKRGATEFVQTRRLLLVH
jgi:mannose/cellobiose epimerase-like protein (N-acyl-D-glucosamine 2-epimerase family)